MDIYTIDTEYVNMDQDHRGGWYAHKTVYFKKTENNYQHGKKYDVKINAIQDIKKLDILYNPASLSYTNYVLNDTRINNTGEKAMILQYKEVQSKEIEGNSKIRQVRKYYRWPKEIKLCPKYA